MGIHRTTPGNYTSRDDVMVQRWLVKEYPKTAVQAKKKGAEIHWLNETGINNQAVYLRGYALLKVKMPWR